MVVSIRKFAQATLLGALAFPCLAQEVSGVHPSYQYSPVMPAGFNPPGIGGLDFLGNDGFIATWGGSQKTAGELWMIPGLATANPGTPARLDGPLREALGLRAVDGALYVLTKPELLKYVKQANGTWSKSTVAKGWAWQDGQWHHFAFSLVHHQGAFYFATGTAYPPDQNEDPQRGSLIKVNPATGSFEALVKGLRNANGVSVGPDGELFATDNQGHWVPSNKLVHLKAGRFYGYRTARNATADTKESPPAIWLPYGGFSHSPTRPLLLKDGPYQGHMLVGDVHHGGIQRYFLEKVGGEYQGACFRFSQGIGYGINELVPGPDGSLYAAGIGGGCCGMDGSGNWNYLGKNNGLARLKPTGTAPFEILALRALKDGFELEFTHPASAGAATAANYSLQSWWYTPTQEYGGNPQGTATSRVTGVQLSADRKKAMLTVENFQPLKVYHLKFANITREGGGAPWTAEAWYTVLKVGPAETPTGTQSESLPSKDRSAVRIQGPSLLALDFPGDYTLRLETLDGRLLATTSGRGPGSLDFQYARSGLHILVGRVANRPYRLAVLLP